MGVVMIKCPNTGRSISTGMRAERSAFGRIAVFFSRTFCPHCRSYHEWFAPDAWVFEPNEISLATGASAFGHGGEAGCGD